MKWQRGHCLLAALLAVLPAAGRAGQPAGEKPVDISGPLTLNRAIEIALANQKQIGIAKSATEAAAARVTQAKSAWFPTVSPSYSFNQQVTTANSNTTRSSQNTSQVGLQQTIFDMGKREQNIAASRDSARAAIYSLLDTRQTVILTVTTDWYDLLRQRDLVRVAESSAQRAKTTLDATQAYVDAGTSARRDVLQAEADYQTAEVQVIEARNNAQLAQTSLKTAMGISSAADLSLPEESVPAPDVTPDSRTVPDYVTLAMDARPDLKGSTSSIKATERSVRVAQIEAGVQVESAVSEGYRFHPDSGEDRTISATVTFPLFDGGSSRARVKEVKATLSEAEQQLELARQNVAAGVESAYLQREAARRSITATDAALKAAQANYDSATESQKEGVGTILDVITAQNALVTAETNAVQAVYDFYTADAALQRAVGSNDPGAAEGGIS